ncbi:hypothetical protein N3K66_000407 [Trichothecium roseum]|uniref:Uncharacterized protein n=1 Tax=Trichothecium roseum TaxID=47278 RepID=A0ACC0VEJ2_9HYPO|nr:hypothetical protein N3K66_000407 [Trichothecium roseum]
MEGDGPEEGEALVLTTQRPDESTRIWTSTQPLWGPAFTLEGYLGRERRQQHIPLARDGGLVPRLLTLGGDSSSSATTPASGAIAAAATDGDNDANDAENGAEKPRPILSSCETLRKRIAYASGSAPPRIGHAYGVGSVFTPPESRGRGYAGKMLSALADALTDTDGHGNERVDGNGDREGAVASVLYSDIGKQFYGRLGWQPFASAHVEFPASAGQPVPSSVALLGDEDLPALAARDEQLILSELQNNTTDTNNSNNSNSGNSGNSGSSKKTRVALLPDVDTLRWHLAREAFTCESLHAKVPSAHGALHACPDGSRVWVVWQRNYSSAVTDPPDQNNKLYILRLVVENPRLPDDDLRAALDGVLGAARREAAAWWCAKVEMWNPDARTRRVVEGLEGWQAKHVDRESDSIASLRWFGQGSTDDVEWIANEKFGWC